MKLRGEVICSVSYGGKWPGPGHSNPSLSDAKAQANHRAPPSTELPRGYRLEAPEALWESSRSSDERPAPAGRPGPPGRFGAGH